MQNESDPDYELIDFGDARKLERFGGVLLDRPSPLAEGISPADRAAWRNAMARYEREEGDSGVWTPSPKSWSPWTIRRGEVVLELRATDFGHVGFFPDHLPTWDWAAGAVRKAGRPLKVLNLFAYTGGATLAVAAAGASVVHVDSARSVVNWARRNAELSGLSEAPIRWITEDALKFAQREVRRGARYGAILLDPPSYGHGPKGQPWKIAPDLPKLLDACRQLLSEHPRLFLLTCHTPGYDGERLADWIGGLGTGQRRGQTQRGVLSLRTSAGRTLPSGSFACWRSE